MKLKRIRYKNALSPLVAILSGDHWIPLELALSQKNVTLDNDARQASSDLIYALQAGPDHWQQWQNAADAFSGPIPEADETPILPFQPLSCRGDAAWKTAVGSSPATFWN